MLFTTCEIKFIDIAYLYTYIYILIFMKGMNGQIRSKKIIYLLKHFRSLTKSFHSLVELQVCYIVQCETCYVHQLR